MTLPKGMKRTFFVVTARGDFYFRVLGYGLSFTKNFPVMFSERYGYCRVLRIGRWAVRWLTP